MLRVPSSLDADTVQPASSTEIVEFNEDISVEAASESRTAKAIAFKIRAVEHMAVNNKAELKALIDQDLIIDLDGSGSLQEAGFGILKSWVGKLLGKYKTHYYGQEKVRLGIVLFGNGVIMPDGKTVSPAMDSQSLIGDKSTVSTPVATLPFNNGFANMAQASLESFGIIRNH